MNDCVGEGAATSDVLEVLGHLGEAVGGAVGEEQDGGVKMEDGGREMSVSRSVRGGSVHKRSASVLSSVSDKSTKRQKK